MHLYLADCGSEGRRSWLRALDTIEQLHPRAVVAGHKDPSASDGPEIIGETRGYIRDFEAGIAATSTNRHGSQRTRSRERENFHGTPASAALSAEMAVAALVCSALIVLIDR